MPLFFGCASKKDAPLVVAYVPPKPRTIEDFALPGPLFCQRDPRWCEIPLGRSRYTVGSSGCTLCCVAMAFNHMGVETDPGRLARFLNSVGGFTADGDLIWERSAAYANGMLAVDYIGKPDNQRIDDSLSRKKPVVTKVYPRGKSQHWVLVVGKMGEEYLVRDPINTENRVQQLTEIAPKLEAIRIFRRA